MVSWKCEIWSLREIAADGYMVFVWDGLSSNLFLFNGGGGGVVMVVLAVVVVFVAAVVVVEVVVVVVGTPICGQD